MKHPCGGMMDSYTHSS